jgi:proline racemase
MNRKGLVRFGDLEFAAILGAAFLVGRITNMCGHPSCEQATSIVETTGDYAASTANPIGWLAVAVIAGLIAWIAYTQKVNVKRWMDGV